MKCVFCEKEIPAARLAALPGADTCVDCSDTERVKGNMTWQGKHTPVLEVVAAEKFRKGRSGFNADIGSTSYNSPFAVKAEVAAQTVRNLSKELRTEPEEYTVLNRSPSRCHPDSPRINPMGDCLACALRKQKARIR